MNKIIIIIILVNKKVISLNTHPENIGLSK